MARPDGSFFTHPTNSEETFAMALALPNPNDGNPIEKTLRIFIFRNGKNSRNLRLIFRCWIAIRTVCLA